jgi:hypothetical protein
LNNGLLAFLTWENPGDSWIALYLAVPAVIAIVLITLSPLPLPSISRIERALASRWFVLAMGVVTTVTFAYEWGSLRQLPLVHDEAAYVLQARLFAAGKWTDSAPIPEFFEQPHVLVTPHLAEKYGPGNALMLVPGIWLGLPGLMPVIMLGVAGMLILILGRRIVNVWVGVLAWMIWLGLATPVTTFRPSYFGEMLTQTLWLAGWWALLRWREERRVGHLLLVAACVGWMAITRPLTAVAFAIPVGAAVLVLSRRHAAWSQLAAALSVGVAFLAVIPVWSAHTTDDWRVTPLMLYTNQYMPYDVPGFGLRKRPLLREASPEIACFEKSYGTAHLWHLPRAIPRNLYARTSETLHAFFADRRLGLLVFAAIGVLASPLELGFMLGTCVILVLAYTTYAHTPDWTVYYLETQPACALLAAAGVWLVIAAVARRVKRARANEGSVTGEVLAQWCMLVLVVLAIIPTMGAARMVHHFKSIGDLPHRQFRQAVDALPDARTIVFVRYAPGEGCQQNLIQNYPPLATARSWIVNDRGADDARLLRVAPDRTPYVFDVASMSMHRLEITTAPAPGR